jgi:NAD-dependent deacetylase
MHADFHPRLVVFTGAGMSVESGIPAFRGAGGLWENHRIEEVASPAAWARHPEFVLRFYNERRRRLRECEPNAGHRLLAALEREFDVTIVTQNVDDLHERAGSTHVLHLHGELAKARSTADPGLVQHIPGWELKLGDRCPLGSQLRPHIVWFGEPVPLMETAVGVVRQADILVIVGTSLGVYPAASLPDFTAPGTPIYLIDPDPPPLDDARILTLRAGASAGLAVLADRLRRDHGG